MLKEKKYKIFRGNKLPIRSDNKYLTSLKKIKKGDYIYICPLFKEGHDSFIYLLKLNKKELSFYDINLSSKNKKYKKEERNNKGNTYNTEFFAAFRITNPIDLKYYQKLLTVLLID